MKKYYWSLFGLLLSQTLYATNDDALEQELKYLQAEKLGSMVEVVSKQKEDKYIAAGIVSIVTRSDIERFGGNSLFDILSRVTSVYMLGGSIANENTLSMRGDLSDSSDAHTLVLINGRPFRDSSFGGSHDSIFRDFPIHQIERLEIIRGPGSALYGTNAYSAVINIVTRKRQVTAVTVRGRYGSFNNGQGEAEFAWKNEQTAVAGAVRYRVNNGWRYVNNQADLTNDLRLNEDDFSATLQGQWQDFTLNTFVAKTHRQHLGPSSFLASSGTPYDSERFFLDIGYKKQFNSHWTTQSNFTYNQMGDDQYVPAISNNSITPTLARTSENNLLFEQTHFMNFWNKSLNMLVGGLLEWQSGRINQIATQPPLPDYSHLKASLYGEMNYALLSNLKLTLGGQWNYLEHLEKDTDRDNQPAKPIQGLVGRLGLVYELTRFLGVKVLFSQAFRSPSAFELGANAIPIRGSENLQPERVETLDAQIFYHEDAYQAALTVFRSRQSGFIHTIDCIPCLYVNNGSAVYLGFELETQAHLWDKLHWQGSYTYQTNRDGNKNNNVSLMPHHLAKIGLSYDVNPDLQLGVFNRFYSKALVNPSIPVFNPAAGSYHNLSFNGNYRLNHLLGLNTTYPIVFNAYLDNILDESIYYPVTDGGSYNTTPGLPGRTLYGELAITF